MIKRNLKLNGIRFKIYITGLSSCMFMFVDYTRLLSVGLNTPKQINATNGLEVKKYVL